MEFFDNKLCISFRELVDGGIMTVPNYKYMASSGRIKVARRGGGAKGNGALIVIDSLPTSYKEKVEEKYPGGNAVLLRGWIISNYELDQAPSLSLWIGLPGSPAIRLLTSLPESMR